MKYSITKLAKIDSPVYKKNVLQLPILEKEKVSVGNIQN